MIIPLRLFFVVVLVSMLAVVGWASLQVPLFDTPREVATHPWFLATLADTYWAFLTFFIWLAWKEASWPHASLWLLAILLLGNMAMALYCLIQLFSVPATAKVEEVIRRRGRPVAWWVPASLVGGILALAPLA